MVNIEVLCTNGHRVRVTATPNSTLLQILTEACNRKNIKPVEDFGLRHNGKTLDLSLPLRYSLLTNNAKVEMIRTDSGKDSVVTVALQVDNGERRQVTCPSTSNLEDLISQFAKSFPEMSQELSQDAHADLTPVIVYLREEIPGWFCLRNTSLKMLGLQGGRVAFRLVWRRDIAEQVSKAETEIRSRLSSTSKPDLPATASDDVTSAPPVADTSAPPAAAIATSATSAPPAVAPVSFPIPSNSSSAGPARAFSWFNDLPTPQPPQRQPVVSAFDNNPFSRALLQPAPATPDLANFKFPDSTAGQNLYENELSEAQSRDYQSCDRRVVWYKPGANVESKIDTEVPDSFFDVTESDLRMMMADLKRQVNAEAEAPLMTASMRLAAKEAKYDKYERAVVRFVFPDSSVLQAIFRPRETVHSLYKFMDKQLKGGLEDYHLYTSPPKVVLKTRDKTLIEADLVPLSRIYVGGGSNSGETSDFRLSSVSFSTPKEAYEVVLDVMRSVSITPQTTSERRPQSSDVSNSVRQEAKDGSGASKKVPKWFKTGK